MELTINSVNVNASEMMDSFANYKGRKFHDIVINGSNLIEFKLPCNLKTHKLLVTDSCANNANSYRIEFAKQKNLKQKVVIDRLELSNSYITLPRNFQSRIIDIENFSMTQFRSLSDGLVYGTYDQLYIRNSMVTFPHIDGGCDMRGYGFYAIFNKARGWIIVAGCKNYTLEQAKAHWSLDPANKKEYVQMRYPHKKALGQLLLQQCNTMINIIELRIQEQEKDYRMIELKAAK